MIEISACAAEFAQLVAAENAPNRRFRRFALKHWQDGMMIIAELENNDCYITRTFPKTRLHKISGIQESVYRADINKISGWRLHMQYSKKDNRLHLKDVVAGQKHDDVIKAIKAKKQRYEK